MKNYSFHLSEESVEYHKKLAESMGTSLSHLLDVLLKSSMNENWLPGLENAEIELKAPVIIEEVKESPEEKALYETHFDEITDIIRKAKKLLDIFKNTKWHEDIDPTWFSKAADLRGKLKSIVSNDLHKGAEQASSEGFAMLNTIDEIASKIPYMVPRPEPPPEYGDLKEKKVRQPDTESDNPPPHALPKTAMKEMT
jgi:hypothetical protein